jgi:nitrogenase molybdenum-iron protein beta chain
MTTLTATPTKSAVTRQKRVVAINPTRTCAPIGAMLATYGIEGALTINHGSQGCATYPRHQLTRHTREPCEVATTSLTESAAVYGGKENLLLALKNIYERFHPTMITVCTTCLSETIGDDIPAIIDEFLENYPEVDIPIVDVNTPSYIGTHITGFDNFLEVMARQLVKRGRTPNNKVNVMPGWVNPGDIRELKALTKEMGIETIFLTDYSDTLDGGYYAEKPHFPIGGTTLDEIRDSANSLGMVALQKHVGGKAAQLYDRRYGVPSQVLPMPIGLENTDKLLDTLAEMTGKEIPASIQMERARLLDAMVDAHMYVTSMKVALYGDPDVLEGLVRFTAELGLQPRFVATATESKSWGEDMLKLAEELDLQTEFMMKTDLHELHKRIKAEPVDLIIGHSKGKFIAEDENIPLVRAGFPVEDRFGYHRRAIIGYRGGMYLVDEIVNAFLSQKTVVSNTIMDMRDLEGCTLGETNGNGSGNGHVAINGNGSSSSSLN